MTADTLKDTIPLKDHEAHARAAGAAFGKDILGYMAAWQGPATVAAIAGYIASKNGSTIGKAQLTVGLGLIAAGAIAEAASLKKQNPDLDIKNLEKKVTRRWLERVQAPSNVSLMIGLLGMIKKIKGSEAAFIAGAIGTVISFAPDIGLL